MHHKANDDAAAATVVPRIDRLSSRLRVGAIEIIRDNHGAERSRLIEQRKADNDLIAHCGGIQRRDGSGIRTYV
jgi:hypothetical protein